MIIRLISKNNGVGLTQDAAVIKEAINRALSDRGQGSATFSFAQWDSQPASTEPKVDLNIHLELLGAAYLSRAHKNVLVPNPEWYYTQLWDMHLRRIDEVWCKTVDCYRIFKQRHHHAVYTGWTSTDRYHGDIDRQKSMIHVAGLSSAKGTGEVLMAMERLPDHHLYLVTGQDRGPLPKNVENVGRVDDRRLEELMNTCLIHVCPSSYEGFGHYINEARAVGAVIITTNAAPMTDLVSKAYGWGASVATVSNQNLAQHKHVDVESLMACIESANRRTPDVLFELGQRAREHYLKDRATFHAAIRNLV